MGAHVKAYAKLNLTLSVTGASGGFHTLDSLVCRVDLFDYIVLKKRKGGDISINIRGRGLDFLPPEKNNAYKAAVAYQRETDCGGAEITVYKNIPVGGGLGGSSADVAGVLRGMNNLFGALSESRLKAVADSLGSDSGYMLSQGYARLSGRGDIVRAVECSHRLNFLLLVPPAGVSTAQCFAVYDGSPVFVPSSDGALSALLSGDVAALGASLNNALYPAACKLNPDILTAYEELSSFSPCGVCMTGSGSGVFALFQTAELCAWAKSRYRGKFECIQLKTV